MFNPFQMMQNPNQLVLEQMKNQNPKLFQKVQEMTRDKNENQLKELANNIAKERGIDLNNFASQFGLKL